MVGVELALHGTVNMLANGSVVRLTAIGSPRSERPLTRPTSPTPTPPKKNLIHAPGALA